MRKERGRKKRKEKKKKNRWKGSLPSFEGREESSSHLIREGEKGASAV